MSIEDATAAPAARAVDPTVPIPGSPILLAGDNFVRNDILAEAIGGALPSMPELFQISLPWPEVPFGPIAEVDEASGSEDDLIAAIAGAEIVITQMAPLTARVLDHAPRLRLIVCTRGGPVNVNVPAATERGIAVSCTPGRNAVAAAEYTLLLILAALRRLAEGHTTVAAGQWRSDLYAYGECGGELAGATVGVIGLGEIGRRVAGLLHAIGATVVAHDPFAPVDDLHAELMPLPDLLRRSDVISLHARLTPQSDGMIGADELALLRRGTVLVNTARGGLLDYDAATQALMSGRLAALALDVFPVEPVPADSPLLRLPGVVLSPHLAGATRQTAHRAAAMAAAEVRRYHAGAPLAYAVNEVPARPAEANRS